MLKTITHYQQPGTIDLVNLKNHLGYTSEQMAELLGVAGGNQWRKYTGGKNPRPLGMHYLFFLAARLSLDAGEFSRVLDTMRELGASFEFAGRHKEKPLLPADD